MGTAFVSTIWETCFNDAREYCRFGEYAIKTILDKNKAAPFAIPKEMKGYNAKVIPYLSSEFLLATETGQLRDLFFGMAGGGFSWKFFEGTVFVFPLRQPTSDWTMTLTHMTQKVSRMEQIQESPYPVDQKAISRSGDNVSNENFAFTFN